MNTELKSGIVRVHKRDESYTIMDPYFLSDERLSWKSKGLLAYLLSKPSNWHVYVSDLVKRSKDGKDAVYSALKELDAAGYIDRAQTRENGRITGYETVVFERPRPVTENPEVDAEVAAGRREQSAASFPQTENPDMANPSAANPTQVVNDLNNIDFKNERMYDTDDLVLAALSRSLAHLPLNDTHSLADFYFAGIFSALTRSFMGRIDPEVIEIAAEHYRRAAIDPLTNHPKITVNNPVGLFVDAYRSALAEWKAVRYKRRG